MTSVAFLSFCFVVLLAQLNQVKCDDEMSLDDEEMERMKRDAARDPELYDRMKRQLDLGRWLDGFLNIGPGRGHLGGNVNWPTGGVNGTIRWGEDGLHLGGEVRTQPRPTNGRGKRDADTELYHRMKRQVSGGGSITTCPDGASLGGQLNVFDCVRLNGRLPCKKDGQPVGNIQLDVAECIRLISRVIASG